jgi:C-terminal processing protease CtpA/Prc
MSKAWCVVFLSCLFCASAQAQTFSGDDYVTGMTVVGKPGSDSSCPPIVWIVKLDTPAAKAGIQPGDRIVEIEGHREIDIVQAQSLLRTKDAKPSTIELDGEHGSYRVTVGRIQASVLYEREGLKLGPDGGLYPKDATETEMLRVSKINAEPPPSEKVFQVGHYPGNLELYYPGFEIFVWKAPQLMAVGGIEEGPAHTAGVHYGDSIISVNGIEARGKSIQELEQLFSSPKPAAMTLVIERDHVTKTFTFQLARASDVATANHKRIYEGRMIPSAIPAAYLHCVASPHKAH